MIAKTGSSLKHILLATDFSPRSDRAARRAVLLARQFGARITMVHVVDDDRPAHMVKRARAEATAALGELCATMSEVDGVDCADRIALGEAFSGVLDVSDDVDPNVIIIGPHRRRILKDVFIGTTAERVIRKSSRPVLMVNGTPTSAYSSVLVAVDMSPSSAAALRVVNSFKLRETARVTVLHVFDPPARGLLRRASLPDDAIEDYIDEAREQAERELRMFLSRESFERSAVVLHPSLRTVPGEIREAAKESAADLIVLGSRGRSDLARTLLGSVSEEILRTAERDVLAVPSGPE